MAWIINTILLIVQPADMELGEAAQQDPEGFQDLFHHYLRFQPYQARYAEVWGFAEVWGHAEVWGYDDV